MKRVIVSHPHGNANALGVARGLHRGRRLASYVTGLAAHEGSSAGRVLQRLSGRAPVLQNRVLDDRGLPLRSFFATEAAARLVGRLSRRIPRLPASYDAMFIAHDAALATRPWPAADAVYCYEDGALWTFERARRRGVTKIWDLPLPHYATLEALWAEEQAAFPSAMGATPRVEPAWKKRRKDAELAAADHVCVASSFTESSLRRAGFRAPIEVIPYGFPVDEFPLRARAPSGQFTVLVVGSQNLRKGTPYLLEAWRRAALPEAQLLLVGPLGLTDEFLAPYRGTFEHRPHASKDELRSLYAAADVLAFPTLGDGFGLVMQEAMCTGTPVITTRCGGGPECIDDDVDGWLIEERDIDALAARLVACHADREATAEVGLRARARAERYTWADAGARVERWVAGLS
jgi:glycosyltransferase involved in cell wall biosynthesis